MILKSQLQLIFTDYVQDGKSDLARKFLFNPFVDYIELNSLEQAKGSMKLIYQGGRENLMNLLDKNKLA